MLAISELFLSAITPLLFLGGLFVIGYVLLWIFVLDKKSGNSAARLQTDIVPFRQKPPVPWNIWGALAIMFSFFLLPAFLMFLILQIPPEQRTFLPETVSTDSLSTEFAPKENISEENNLTENLPKNPSSDINSDETPPPESVSEKNVQIETEQKKTAETNKDKNASDDQKLGKQHPLTVLLLRSQESPMFWSIVLLCFFTGVIAAPLAEEFIFRVVFQGVLERETVFFLQKNFSNDSADQVFSKFSDRSNDFENFIRPTNSNPSDTSDNSNCLNHLNYTDHFTCSDRSNSSRRQNISIFRFFSLIPILIPAMIFALIHYRSASDGLSDMNLLVLGMIVMSVSNILVWGLGSLILLVCGATFSDLGWQRKTFFVDFRNGLTVACLTIPLLFLFQGILEYCFSDIVVDPFSIFAFAFVLGTVFHRTRSFVSVLTIHIALNLTSLTLLLIKIGWF